MAPGSGVNMEVVEFVKYDAGMVKMEIKNTLAKNVSGAGENHRISSTNGVHELFECSICMSLMYPLIYQATDYTSEDVEVAIKGYFDAALDIIVVAETKRVAISLLKRGGDIHAS